MVLVTAEDDDDARFQLAAEATRRLVGQCRAHVAGATTKLSFRLENAPASTPFATDYASAAQGDHLIAFEQRIKHVEAMCNALLAHLRGLEVLLNHDTFYPLPAVSIARAAAEVSASCAWILDSTIGSDERAARAYAALFRSIEKNISETLTSDSEATERLRERLVKELSGRGIRVVRRVKDKKITAEVAQVLVGRAHAKTNFQYSQRIAEEIPSIGGMYSGMSGAAHGEHVYISTSWDSPDMFARMIGVVVHRSVEAWSRAIHSWIGVQPGPFINQNDVKNLIRSMPRESRDRFQTMSQDR